MATFKLLNFLERVQTLSFVTISLISQCSVPQSENIILKVLKLLVFGNKKMTQVFRRLKLSSGYSQFLLIIFDMILYTWAGVHLWSIQSIGRVLEKVQTCL